MVISRPSILIYADNADEDYLRELCAGIEEEGVLYQVIPAQGELDTLAHRAAEESMLGSGIGLCGVDAAMQMRGLKKGQNAESYHMPTYEQCRKLGANSARAIKKLPFK